MRSRQRMVGSWTVFKNGHCNRNTLHTLLCKDIKAKVSLYLQQEAMGNKQPVGLGDKNTADVRLYLMDSATVIQYPRNTLLLHSHVLKKAEFFETKLSQSSYSPRRPFEIKITCNPESYIKCIQLMYSYYTEECFNFNDVDEALAILPVASEAMSRDCMESCMRYLDAVRWSPVQEAKLRVVLSSLNITVLPDLTARLGMSQSKSDCQDIKMVKESLQELLKNTYDRREVSSIVKQHIFDYLKLNTSPAIKDACRHVILNQFNADLKCIKSKSGQRATDVARDDLYWLLGVIRHCDAKMFATVVKEFCEDSDLRNAVAGGKCDMSTILIAYILKAMENGEIITPISFRVDFLSNWADIMLKLLNRNSYYSDRLERGIIRVVETLPLVEQKRIYDIFTKNSTRTITLRKWWAEKLHNGIILHDKDFI